MDSIYRLKRNVKIFRRINSNISLPLEGLSFAVDEMFIEIPKKLPCPKKFWLLACTISIL